MTEQAIAPVPVKATRTLELCLDDGQTLRHTIAIESDDENEGDFSQWDAKGHLIFCGERTTVEGVIERLSRAFFKKVNEIGFNHNGRMYLSHRIKHIDISDEVVRG
jgi:hypothetical protein